MAAGLVVTTSNPWLRSDIEPFKIVLDWTGNTDVALSAGIAATLKEALIVAGRKGAEPQRIKGKIVKAEFIPGASGDILTYIPAGTYAVTLVDPHGYDILDGNGAARSISAAEAVVFETPLNVDEEITLTIASTASTDQLAGDGAFSSVANWTLGAGWSDTTGEITKGAGTGTVTHVGASAFAAVAGRKYTVVFTVGSWAAAANRSLVCSVGGTDGTAVTEDGTYTQEIVATNTDGLVFTPTGTDATNIVCTLDSVTVKFTDPQGRVILFVE